MAPTQPKVSVLIPAYNEEKYIGKCLDALGRINYPSLEIIVCNNNSTDKTSEIVAGYPNVTLLNETKPGPNAARQKAFLASTGDIVVTLDADCLVDQDWIDRGVPHFNDTRISAVCGIYVFDSDKLFSKVLAIEQKYILRFFHFVLQDVMHKYGIMIAGNAWIRSSSLKAVGGFNTDIKFWGDDAHTAEMLTTVGHVDYDHRLTVLTSSRRFNHVGPWRTMYHYFINYLSMWLLKKPVSGHDNTNNYR